MLSIVIARKETGDKIRVWFSYDVSGNTSGVSRGDDGRSFLPSTCCCVTSFGLRQQAQSVCL